MPLPEPERLTVTLAVELGVPSCVARPVGAAVPLRDVEMDRVTDWLPLVLVV